MPVYNEEGCLEPVVREALAALDALDGAGEVLVVDDGSTDRTPEILARLAAADPRLRVVTHPSNQGIGGFNRRMMAEARGEWVLFTSSDGEFDPREGLRFLVLAEREGADAVLGYRAAKRYDRWRLAVSWSFNALTYLAFGARFRDIGSTRLLRRSLFQPIALYSGSAFLNAERLLAGRRRGARIVEVPTVHRPRLAGTGGGARPRKVAAAFADLARTRVRWIRFERYYGDRGAPGA
jgi:glycosyltransferase involved in cell wall biosynthesis